MLPSMNPSLIASTLVLSPAPQARKGALQQLKGRLGLMAVPTARSDTRTRLLWAMSQLGDVRARLLFWAMFVDMTNAWTPPPNSSSFLTVKAPSLDRWEKQGQIHILNGAKHAVARNGVAVEIEEAINIPARHYGKRASRWTWLKVPEEWTLAPDVIPLQGTTTRWDPWIPWLAKEAAALVRAHDKLVKNGPDFRAVDLDWLYKQSLVILQEPIGVDLHGTGPLHPTLSDVPGSQDTKWAGLQMNLAMRDIGIGARVNNYDYGRVRNMIDWLEEERPNIMPMSLAEAVDRSDEWHKQFAASASYGSPVTPGLTVVTWPDGWRIDRLVTARECEEEGQSMGHCVGGHWKYVRDGDELIFSIRDETGKPWGTAAIEVDRGHLADDVNSMMAEEGDSWSAHGGSREDFWDQANVPEAVFDGRLPVRGEWTRVSDLKGHDNRAINSELAAERMRWFLLDLLDTDTEGHEWALGRDSEPKGPMSIDGRMIPDWMKEDLGLEGEPAEDWENQFTQAFLELQNQVDVATACYREVFDDADFFDDKAPGLRELQSFYSKNGETEEDWGVAEEEEHDRLRTALHKTLDDWFMERRGEELDTLMEEWDQEEEPLTDFCQWYANALREHDAQHLGQEAWESVKAELELLASSIENVTGEVGYSDHGSHDGDWYLKLEQGVDEDGYEDHVATVVANGTKDWDQIPEWDVYGPEDDGRRGDRLGESKHSALHALLSSHVLLTTKQAEEELARKKAELEALKEKETEIPVTVTDQPQWAWLHPDITVPMHSEEATLDRDQRRTMRKLSASRNPESKIRDTRESDFELKCLLPEEGCEG
jgi:hypothetical protein